MKLFYKNIPFAISFILFGLINILIHFNFIELDSENLISFVMIYLGIHLVFQEMTQSHHGLLSFGVVSFFVGLTIFVFHRINIIFWYKTLFGAAWFVIGMVFLFLFLNNTKQRFFLKISFISIIFSLVSIYLKDFIPFHGSIDIVSRYILDNWYLMLAGLGYILLTKRKIL